MDISKSVARKIMMVVLMVAALVAVSFSVNASHVQANAAAKPQAVVQVKQNNNQPKNNRQNQVNNVNNNKVNTVNQNNNDQNNQQNGQFNRVMKVAKSKLGDRYVWGGNGPKHFDCSGFTRYIYRKGIHKTLPRLAGDQYYNYKHVSKAHRRAGDLVFFGSSRRSITHVGMYIGRGKMIDAQLRGVTIENVKAPWWHAVGYSRPFNLK